MAKTLRGISPHYSKKIDVNGQNDGWEEAYLVTFPREGGYAFMRDKVSQLREMDKMDDNNYGVVIVKTKDRNGRDHFHALSLGEASSRYEVGLEKLPHVILNKRAEFDTLYDSTRFILGRDDKPPLRSLWSVFTRDAIEPQGLQKESPLGHSLRSCFNFLPRLDEIMGMGGKRSVHEIESRRIASGLHDLFKFLNKELLRDCDTFAQNDEEREGIQKLRQAIGDVLESRKSHQDILRQIAVASTPDQRQMALDNLSARFQGGLGHILAYMTAREEWLGDRKAGDIMRRIGHQLHTKSPYILDENPIPSAITLAVAGLYNKATQKPDHELPSQTSLSIKLRDDHKALAPFRTMRAAKEKLAELQEELQRVSQTNIAVFGQSVGTQAWAYAGARIALETQIEAQQKYIRSLKRDEIQAREVENRTLNTALMSVLNEMRSGTSTKMSVYPSSDPVVDLDETENRIAKSLHAVLPVGMQKALYLHHLGKKHGVEIDIIQNTLSRDETYRTARAFISLVNREALPADTNVEVIAKSLPGARDLYSPEAYQRNKPISPSSWAPPVLAAA